MAIKIYYGDSRSNKLSYVYEQMNMEITKHSYKECFVIVPEQFSLKTQEEVIDCLPNHGTNQIQVYSFQKLADWVFLKENIETRKILDESGKTMLLRKVVQKFEEELVLLKGKLHKQSYLEELKSVFSEFEQYQLEVSDLENVCKEIQKKSLIQLKLSEMKVLYEAYLKSLQETYMSGEGKLKYLSDILRQRPIFKDSLFIFHGYTGFTPLQYEVLKSLLSQCPDIWVVLTLSNETKGRDYVFELTNETIRSLYGLGEETFHPVYKTHIKESSGSEEIAFLEKNIFSVSAKKRKNRTEDIFLKSFNDRYEEIRHIASLIKDKVSHHLRYQDMGVILGDLKGYQPIVHRIFKEYNIPFFFDGEEEGNIHPMIGTILSALSILQENFSYESIFQYTSMGYTDLSLDEIYRLDNYILSQGIKGRKSWQSDFERSSGLENKDQTDLLRQMNDLRIKLITPILELGYFFGRKKFTVGERLKGLFHFIQEISLYEKVIEKENLLTTRFGFAEGESEEIYENIIRVLDQMYQLLGEDYLTRKDFIDVLTAGLLSIGLKPQPPAKDRVIVGDASRTRLNHIHTLFFGGINEGMSVGLGKEGGLVTDKDKHLLKEWGIELSPSRSKSVGTSKFYMYLTLTVPKEKLYLSYARLDQEGKKLESDYSLKQLAHLFENISTWEEKKTWSIEDELAKLADLLKDCPHNNQTLQIMASLRKTTDFGMQIEKICQGSFLKYLPNNLDQQLIQEIYGKQVHTSVSRLEKYAACPYSYFLQFGLKLKERKIFEVGMSDIGSIVHGALEEYGKIVKNHQLTWNDVSIDQRNKWMLDCLSLAYHKDYQILFNSSPRYAYLRHQIERLLKLNIDALSRQLSYSNLEPLYFEKDFHYTIEDSFMPIHLHGCIDRVDKLSLDSKEYIHVIDYKTGKKKFDLTLLGGGLQLQLPLYLEAMMNELQKTYKNSVEPGGFFYYQIQEPWLPYAKSDLESFQKTMRLSGVLNDDRTYIGAFDRHLADVEGWKKSQDSLIVPISITKKNELSSRSQKIAISKENIRKIINLSKKQVKTIVSQIQKGQKEIRPYELNQELVPCQYCPYSSICQINSNTPGVKTRLLEEKTLESLESEEA